MSSIKKILTHDLQDFKNGFLSNPFNFKNRASRKEFLTVIAVYLLYLKINSIINYEPTSLFIAGITLLVGFFIELQRWRATVRRLHDLNMSGWWSIGIMFFSGVFYFSEAFEFGFFGKLSLLILLGIILFLVVKKGSDGPNNYGQRYGVVNTRKRR